MSVVADSYGVDWTMEPLEGKPAKDVLEKTVQHIKGTYWLSAGTMLGIYRDGSLIDHDTDIDIGVLAGASINLPKEYKLFRTVTDGDKMMQEAYIYEPDNVIVDILHYWPLDTYGFIIYNEGQEGRLFRPRDMILPTQKILFEGALYRAPNRIEDYLTIWYEETWNIPIKGGKTKWLK